MKNNDSKYLLEYIYYKNYGFWLFPMNQNEIIFSFHKKYLLFTENNQSIFNLSVFY